MKNKTIKLFGIGAAVLMILVVVGSPVTSRVDKLVNKENIGELGDVFLKSVDDDYISSDEDSPCPCNKPKKPKNPIDLLIGSDVISRRDISIDNRQNDIINHEWSTITHEEYNIIEINEEIWEYLFNAPFNADNSYYRLFESVGNHVNLGGVYDPPEGYLGPTLYDHFDSQPKTYEGTNNYGQHFELIVDLAVAFEPGSDELISMLENDPVNLALALQYNFGFSIVWTTLQTTFGEVYVLGMAISCDDQLGEPQYQFTVLKYTDRPEFIPSPDINQRGSPPGSISGLGSSYSACEVAAENAYIQCVAGAYNDLVDEQNDAWEDMKSCVRTVFGWNAIVGDIVACIAVAVWTHTGIVGCLVTIVISIFIQIEVCVWIMVARVTAAEVAYLKTLLNCWWNYFCALAECRGEPCSKPQ